MKVLITGCAGFIGSHLSEALLDRGYSVFGIDNFDDFYSRKIKEKNIAGFINHPMFFFHEIDIRDSSALGLVTEKMDVVVHLAAKVGILPSTNEPLAYVDTNILGTTNILEYMRSNGCKKLVFASSSSVYGDKSATPFTEDENVDEPISVYAQTKRSGELLNTVYHHLFGFDVLNLRFFTVFGPRQRPDLAIHKFVQKIKNGEPIEMFGEGETARDYTYIDDIIFGIISAIELLKSNQNVQETINLGSGNPIKLGEMISTLYTVFGEQPNIIKKPLQLGDMKKTFANISKAQKILGFSPSSDFVQGIYKFKDWYEVNN